MTFDDGPAGGDDDRRGLFGYVFAVGERPCCCWDFDHQTRTLEFLDGLDTGYFQTLASILAERLESDEALPVSVQLRISYHQGLETLFSLLAAMAQAPDAIPAWIGSASTEDLKQVVGSLRDGRPILTQAGRSSITFPELARLVHRHAWSTEQGDDSTAQSFGGFWRRLANEFLDDSNRAEYNALKHGSRVLPGGFTLAFGVEAFPGVAAPATAMRSLGGSRFGTTFFVVERAGQSKLHVRTRRTSLNWTPMSLAQRLSLVSMSISNVVGALRCGLGVDPSTVEFHRPVPLAAFESVWAREPGTRSTSIDSIIRIEPSDELTKEELIGILEQRGGCTSPSPEPDPKA
jgi:hypothetical protein